MDDRRTEELAAWGVKFYEMGFDACMDSMALTCKAAKKAKTKAVNDYIKTLLKKDKEPIGCDSLE